jgi:DNA-binding transcriptional MerR regulator
MKADRHKTARSERMRISAAAKAAGVSTQTVEYYVMLGLIEPLRAPGRRGRFFNAAHVKRIRLIRQLNASGYTLRAIRETYLRGR